MTANHDLERRVAAFYATEDPQRAPDRVLLRALEMIDTTRQRRELRLLPWRFPTMNSYAKLAVTAAVVLAVGAIGLAILRPGQGPSVGGPGPSSSPVPSALPSTPPLTERLTSSMHGLSISYPEGWAAVPATESAPTGEAGFLDPTADWLYDPELRDHLFIVLGSEPLDGEVGMTWATAVMDDPELGCIAGRVGIAVDGEAGLICETLALVWSGDRGYSIRLYVSPDDPQVVQLYDRAWFEEVLATVQLPPAP